VQVIEVYKIKNRKVIVVSDSNFLLGQMFEATNPDGRVSRVRVTGVAMLDEKPKDGFAVTVWTDGPVNPGAVMVKK
jgi:hypothetical protein